MSEYVDGPALLQVLISSLVGGAGLVAVFALGLVGWSAFRLGATAEGGTASARAGSVAGLVLACGCFAVVLTGVGLGLYVMLAAKG